MIARWINFDMCGDNIRNYIEKFKRGRSSRFQKNYKLIILSAKVYQIWIGRNDKVDSIHSHVNRIQRNCKVVFIVFF